MRISVLSFCVFILAACFVLLHQSPFWRNSARPHTSIDATKESKKLVSREHTLPEVRTVLTPNMEPVQSALPPDWERRFSEISSEPAWLQSQEEFEALADSLPKDQMRYALDQLKTNQSDAAAILGEVLLRRWVTNSLLDAVQWVEHLPEGDFARVAFREVAVDWSQQDLAGAVDWVQQLPAGGNKAAAELSVADEAATRKEGATAINLIVSLPQSSERDELLDYSARQWATADQKDAVSWIQQVQDPALRENMLANVAIDLAVQNPFDAAAFAATALTPGPGQNQAVINIVRFMAVSAPDRAAAWVEQFPEGSLRVVAMENLMDVWSKNNPEAVRESNKTIL